MSLNNLKLSEHIEYIFTDFFDTVVSRKCHPEEIKIKWASKLCDLFNINLTTEQLYQLRSSCELELCNINLVNFGESEFKYSDMLCLLYSRLICDYGFSFNDSEKFYQKAKEIEVDIEKEYQFLNEDVINFLRFSKSEGKVIHVVSDFYLDRDSIKSLINHHGVMDLFNEVYVSSDYMATKRTGRLYNEILKRNCIQPRSILMIGDNEYSDFHRAKEIGLNAFHLLRDMSFYEKSLQTYKNKSLYAREIRDLFENNQDFSFMAIPLYLFIRKLSIAVERDNIKKLCFLAREGEFLKELFELYNQNRDTLSVYTMASRRATYLPSLTELNESTFDYLLHQYPRNNIRTLLKSIGFEEIKEYKCKKGRINLDNLHLNLKGSEDYKNLIQSDEFRKHFYMQSSNERENLKSYFSDKMSGDVLCLVDVGWKGSIQNNIQKAINKPVLGYYCGLLSRSEISEKNMKFGLLFKESNGTIIDPYCYNDFRAAFEVFCAASHGSVKRYQKNGEVELDENIKEKEIYVEFIRPIQKNILLTVEKLISLERKFSKNTSESEAVLGRVFRRKSLLPRKSEMELFSKIKHYENFGVFDYTVFNKKEESRLSYFRKLIKNPTLTVSSEFWKPLSFYNNRVGFLRYPFYLYKIFKKG